MATHRMAVALCILDYSPSAASSAEDAPSVVVVAGAARSPVAVVVFATLD